MICQHEMAMRLKKFEDILLMRFSRVSMRTKTLPDMYFHHSQVCYSALLNFDRHLTEVLLLPHVLIGLFYISIYAVPSG